MKRLLLIRHAKSSWEYSIADHLRPLNKRGLRDQERMALFLQDSDEKLDAIYSSCCSPGDESGLRVSARNSALTLSLILTYTRSTPIIWLLLSDQRLIRPSRWRL